MNGRRVTISLALTLAAAFIYYVVRIETTIAIALPVVADVQIERHLLGG